jgi:hypothetical protein
LYLCVLRAISYDNLHHKIDEKTELGKKFQKMLKNFRNETLVISIVENKETEEEEIYNPEFVKVIVERVEWSDNSEKLKEWTVLNPDDVWGSFS